MITYPGEYHDAISDIPIPQSRQTIELIEQGRLMPPLPIQIELRARRTVHVIQLSVLRPVLEAEAA
ncbi:hypothetical protein ACX80J_08685 [Arthrobacter sp. MDB2-24]